MMDKFGYSQFPWGGGMEHQENVFLGTSVAWVIVHELGHQWFGDAITCDTWADSWMHEGFATYCQAIHSEGLYGFNSYISYMQNETVSDPSGPIYDYYSIFDVNTIYHKGAWVLHMLRGVMGDSAFFQGMRAYVANPDHLYGTITTREFQHLMEPFYGDSLGWFFDEWVWGMNRPFYLYSWMKQDIENGRYEIFLNIRQIQGSPAPSVFTMPIKVYPRINNVDTVITVWDDARIDDFRFIVDGNPDSLFLDEMPWILHNSSLGSYAMNIVTTSLPDGHIGDVYLDTIEARGGTPPYHFILQSGHLPTGLTLSDGGIISGTPTLVEADSFTVRCTDSSSPARTDVQFYNVTIAPPAGCQYILGDINDDNSVNGIDIVYAVNYLKGGGNPPPIDCGNPVGPCPEPSPFFAAGDVNGNCEFNGVDITFFVRFLKLQVPSLLACSDCPPLP